MKIINKCTIFRNSNKKKLLIQFLKLYVYIYLKNHWRKKIKLSFIIALINNGKHLKYFKKTIIWKYDTEVRLIY